MRNNLLDGPAAIIQGSITRVTCIEATTTPPRRAVRFGHFRPDELPDHCRGAPGVVFIEFHGGDDGVFFHDGVAGHADGGAVGFTVLEVGASAVWVGAAEDLLHGFLGVVGLQDVADGVGRRWLGLSVCGLCWEWEGGREGKARRDKG